MGNYRRTSLPQNAYKSPTIVEVVSLLASRKQSIGVEDLLSLLSLDATGLKTLLDKHSGVITGDTALWFSLSVLGKEPNWRPCYVDIIAPKDRYQSLVEEVGGMEGVGYCEQPSVDNPLTCFGLQALRSNRVAHVTNFTTASTVISIVQSTTSSAIYPIKSQ